MEEDQGELVSEGDQPAEAEARKHLRESMPVFERTGEVKQGTSPMHVRRALTPGDFSRMNLPREHYSAHSRLIQEDDTREIVGNYGKRVVEMIKTATGLVLMGPPGVGKSSIAAILAKEAVRWGFSAYFVSHEELADLRFEDRAFAEGTSVMGRIRAVDLLILDNFDARFLSDKRFGPAELEKLVRRRNANLLATILTTRLSDEFGAEDDEGHELYPNLKDTIGARAAPMSVLGDNMRSKSSEETKQRVFGTKEDESV